MEEVYPQVSMDVAARLRDIEEKTRLLKDRVLLIGKSFVDDREQMLETIRELKHAVLLVEQENDRMRAVLSNITKQLAGTARKEEIEIVQRQLDILRK